MSEAAPFYPLVGLCIGATLAVADRGLEPLLRSPIVVNVLLLALWVGITGGLHMDGLADTFDGLGGERTRERALEIMRDSRIGAFGAAAIVMVLALKGGCLVDLGDERWRALLVAPAVGRLAPLLLARLAPAARSDGEGHGFVAAVRWPGVVLALATTLVVACITLRKAWLPVLAVAACLLLTLAAVFRARIGGVTGDTLGAAVELVETVTLVAIAALSGHGWFSQ